MQWINFSILLSYQRHYEVCSYLRILLNEITVCTISRFTDICVSDLLTSLCIKTISCNHSCQFSKRFLFLKNWMFHCRTEGYGHAHILVVLAVYNIYNCYLYSIPLGTGVEKLLGPLCLSPPRIVNKPTLWTKPVADQIYQSLVHKLVLRLTWFQLEVVVCVEVVHGNPEFWRVIAIWGSVNVQEAVTKETISGSSRTIATYNWGVRSTFGSG